MMMKVAIVGIALISIVFLSGCLGDCSGDIKGTDTYYYKSYSCNGSYSAFGEPFAPIGIRFFSCDPNAYECKIGNHTQDAIDKKARDDAATKAQAEAKEREDCYNAGKDYNLSFDLIKDYNLSCEGIDYFNNHLLLSNEEKDGGYIKGTSSGLFSYGSIEGHFNAWVYSKVLATGKIVKSMSYHLDCKNSTLDWKKSQVCHPYDPSTGGCWNPSYEYVDTMITGYYSEADFVRYYVSKCVK